MPQQVLVAGVGNIFLRDDGFGSEVARRLAARPLPDGVRVVDYGIGGIHLAYDLLAGVDLLILVDALTRDVAPGTVSLLEVEPDDDLPGTVDSHAMDPATVFASLRGLGGVAPPTVVVGCEPADVSEGMGLSPPVEAAVDPTVDQVMRLLADQAATEDTVAAGSTAADTMAAGAAADDTVAAGAAATHDAAATAEGELTVHEIGLCESVLAAVERRAQGRPVQGVTVRVGTLLRVAPEAFVQAFDLVAAGGVAEGATPELVFVPVQGRCEDCGERFESHDPTPACPACASVRVAREGGDDLLLESIRYHPAATMER